MRSIILSLFLIMLGTAASQAKVKRANIEIQAINRLIAIYKDLGEEDLAKRVRELYWAEPPRLLFVQSSQIYPLYDLAGVRNGTVASLNQLVIHQNIFGSIRPISDDRFAQKPYEFKFSLLSYAVTVAHELVHLDQYAPDEAPAYEDPAWQHVDELMQRWVKRAEVELAAVRGLPDSPNKRKRLNRLKDLLAVLRSESGALANAAVASQSKGILSPHLKFEFSSLAGRIDAILASLSKDAAVVAKVPPGGGWVASRFISLCAGRQSGGAKNLPGL